MPANNPALVVVAAGGLGTRVHPWARFIPKEFYPVVGRPGITLLLEEIAGLGPARPGSSSSTTRTTSSSPPGPGRCSAATTTPATSTRPGRQSRPLSRRG
jgi:hypothetical protein